MNLWWRTLLTMVRARLRVRFGGRLDPTGVSRVRLTTLPTDLDMFRHMNNGRYLSLADLGRFDLIVRTGVFDAMKKQNWFAVVASETVTFRKSLTLWQRFEIESRLAGHDDRAVYLEHRIVRGGEIYASVLVRARFVKRSGGAVQHDELFAALGRPDDLPPLADWVRPWAEATSLPSTRRPAPSDWS